MKRISVAPGEFKVNKDRSVILETHLGSCVGVALYDPKTHVGGLIHIILPLGSVDKETTTPARYANSGIPLLISEMEKQGALKQRIVAAIAGGAMILTDSKLSVNMNIGRRNAEMVSQILDTEEIPIINKDTGGYFGRTFRLRQTDGKSEVELSTHRKGKLSTSVFPGQIGLNDLKEQIDKLKPISEIARQIISRIEFATCDMSELEKYILKDQALTVNILKICNSPYYRLQKRISTISRAIVLLGLNTLKNIVLTASMYKLYEDNAGGYSSKKGELFKHSLCCAEVAQLIAKQKKFKDADIAFTAGLLHDIGKVILDQYVFEGFNMIIDKVVNEKKSFVAAENEVLGYDHAWAGGMLAEKWNLPPVLVEVISAHHMPERAKKNREMVSTVHIADGICSMIGAGCGADGMVNRIHQKAVSDLGLRRDDINLIVEQLADIVSRHEMLSG